MYGWIGKLTAVLGRQRLGAVFVKWFPEGLVITFLAGTGRFLYWAAPGIRRLIHMNMLEVLGEHGMDSRDIKPLVRRYLTELAATLFELLFLAGQLPERGERNIRVTGLAHLDDALADGRGAVLYAPHLGNFFYYFWRLSQTYDCLAVATAGSPELRPLYLNFARLGCKGLDYDSTPPLELMKRIKSHLSGGGVVFLLGDFYRPSFPVTRLFGRITRGPYGAALLALDDLVPVVPCSGFRESGFRHRVELGKPVRLYEAYTRKERAEAMEELNRALERRILEHPEQWFYWIQCHERWERGLSTGTAPRIPDGVKEA